MKDTNINGRDIIVGHALQMVSVQARKEGFLLSMMPQADESFNAPQDGRVLPESD